jgi:hypothetical protein
VYLCVNEKFIYKLSRLYRFACRLKYPKVRVYSCYCYYLKILNKPLRIPVLKKAVSDLELPGHGECEALVRDVVPLVGKVESPDVHHQLTLHVLHVVMQRRDEMPETRETCHTYIKGCPLIVHHPVFRIRIQSGQWILTQEGKNYTQKLEKIYKFHVLKCWLFAFEG